MVDDGSTDNTSMIASRYPGVHCLRQHNQGLSAARNAGLRSSNGDYLVFLDADDRLLPEALETGLQCLKERPECPIAAGHCRYITVDGFPDGEQSQLGAGEDPYLALLSSCPILVPSVVYRRSIFRSVKNFDPRLQAAEDYDLYYRIAKDFPICCHGHVVGEVRRHAENMTRNTTLMLKANLDALRAQSKHVKKTRSHHQAYKRGIKFWQKVYGPQLANEVSGHIREREWNRALQGIKTLLRYYPWGLTSIR